MKKTTLEYYGAAINRAERAMESIEAAKAAYERESVLAKNALDAGLYGENGYKEAVRKLEADRDAKIEGALSRIDEVSAEYAAEMQELSRLDGNRIDDGVVKLLNSGIKLTTEEWQELADAHKDNFLTTRVLKEKYNEAKSSEGGEGAGFLLGHEGGGLGFVRFGQSPLEKSENFRNFAKLLRYNAASDTMPKEGGMEYASKTDYWNHCARESIGRVQPQAGEGFDNVAEAFPVQMVAAKRTIW